MKILIVIYAYMTRFFDQGILGIQIGILTGVAINVLTGQQTLNEYYQNALWYCLLGVIMLIILLLIRQKMESDLLLKSDVNEQPIKLWILSCGYDSWLRTSAYMLSLILTAISVWIMVCEMSKGNRFELNSTKQEKSLELSSRQQLLQQQQQMLEKIDSLSQQLKLRSSSQSENNLAPSREQNGSVATRKVEQLH